MRTGKNPRNSMRLDLFALGVFIIMAAIVAVPFYSARSSSSPSRSSSLPNAPDRTTAIKAMHSKIPDLPLPATLPPLTSLSLTTYEETCTTPQTDFNLGDKVCVKATGVPGSLFPWRVSWVDPSGVINQLDSASTDDTTQYTYTIPTDSTTTLNENTYDNRGTWTVNLTRPSGAVRLTARFIVHETAKPRADVFIQKFRRDSSDQIHTGENIAFIIR